MENFKDENNQCDGCKRGLPLEDGVHIGKGYDMIGCTKGKYVSDNSFKDVDARYEEKFGSKYWKLPSGQKMYEPEYYNHLKFLHTERTTFLQELWDEIEKDKQEVIKRHENSTREMRLIYATNISTLRGFQDKLEYKMTDQ